MTIFRIIMIILSVFLFLPAWSNQIYQIELIIFSQYSLQTLETENLGSRFPLVINQENVRPITLLPSNAFLLNSIYLRLAQNPRYRPLYHVAWRQAAGTQANIHLYGGNGYDTQGNIIFPNNVKTAFDEAIWEINGYLNIQLHRFSDVKMDFDFAEPRKLLPQIKRRHLDNNNYLTYFHLKQSRRMRSAELNYIDYPLYGILIEVIPLQQQS